MFWTLGDKNPDFVYAVGRGRTRFSSRIAPEILTYQKYCAAEVG